MACRVTSYVQRPNMYAIVEFEERKCAVVPLNWLIDEQQKCHWPRTVRSQLFENMVKACKEPACSWPKYDVIKIIEVIGNFVDFPLCQFTKCKFI